MRVCIHCTNGYLFDEFYFSIINLLGQTYNVSLVIEPSFFTSRIKEKLKEMKSAGTISELHFISNDTGFCALQRHHELHRASKSLGTIDLLLIGPDDEYSSIYLINQARKNNGFIISISFTTNWPMLLYYGGEEVFGKIRSESKIAKLQFVEKLLNRNLFVLFHQLLIRLQNKAFKYISSKVKPLLHYRLFPLLVTGRQFKYSKFHQQRVPAGRADLYLFFDRTEEAVAQQIGFRTALLKHPAEPCDNTSANGKNSLIVIFNGCLTTELPEESLSLWLERIFEIRRLVFFERVILRPHPRTSSNVRWLQEMNSRLISTGLVSRISYSLEESLKDVISEGLGVLGGPSGALRWARALRRDIFIIGLANCMDKDPGDQAWALGQAGYVKWLEYGTNISPKDLIPVVDSPNQPMEINEIICAHAVERFNN